MDTFAPISNMESPRVAPAEINGHPLASFASWPASGASPAGYFTRSQLTAASSFYAEHGFIVLEDGVDAAGVEALTAEAAQICRGTRGTIPGRMGLPGVVQAPADASDAEVMRQYLCIHFPHKVSPVMYDSLSQPGVVDVLTRVIGPNVKCMQSMLFIKASGKPGQAWHQDEYFIPTRDRSLTGAWIALDDATVLNGCLWVIPGSHKHGIIWPHHVHNDRRFDCTTESINFPYTDDDAVPVEVKKGSIVFFNGYLLHRSLPNYARAGFRRSLVNHYMSAESLLPWHPPQAGDKMGTLDYRDVVLVAGRDPYAWKGMEDRAQAHVRPDGEGGCGDPRLNVAAMPSAAVSMAGGMDDDDDHED